MTPTSSRRINAALRCQIRGLNVALKGRFHKLATSAKGRVCEFSGSVGRPSGDCSGQWQVTARLPPESGKEYAPATRALPIYSTTLDPAFAHLTLSFPTSGMRSHSESIGVPPCAFISALNREAVYFGFGVPSPTIFRIAVTYPGL